MNLKEGMLDQVRIILIEEIAAAAKNLKKYQLLSLTFLVLQVQLQQGYGIFF